MASLLQKTRKISTILQEGRHENVDFEAMAMRLSPILDSVVYILDTEGTKSILRRNIKSVCD